MGSRLRKRAENTFAPQAEWVVTVVLAALL